MCGLAEYNNTKKAREKANYFYGDCLNFLQPLGYTLLLKLRRINVHCRLSGFNTLVWAVLRN